MLQSKPPLSKAWWGLIEAIYSHLVCIRIAPAVRNFGMLGI